MSFKIHTKNTAPEISNTILDNFEQAMGFVPNLLGVFAESPFALKSVEAINHGMADSVLTPIELRVVTVTSSLENECQYCVPAQSTLAQMAEMPDATLTELRAGEPLTDTKLETLRQFTLNVIHNKGWVPENEVEEFIKQGFSRTHVLDVTTLIALMTLTNYVSHLSSLPLDDAFMPQQWASAQQKTA